MIDEDAAHHLRAERQEVAPVLTLDGPRAQQLEVRLVGEGGRLEARARTASTELTVGDAAEFRVGELHEAVERARLTGLPAGEKPPDLGVALRRHSSHPSVERDVPFVGGFYWVRIPIFAYAFRPS